MPQGDPDKTRQQQQAGGDEQQGARAVNKQRRRDRILVSAATIIVQEGFEALTLAKVAEMADVTVPTIHNLFGRKQDIYNTLTDLVMRWTFDTIDVTTGGSMLDDMEAGLERYIVQLREEELFFKAGYLIGERIGYYSKDGNPCRSASDVSIQAYTRMIADSELKGDLNPRLLAKFVRDNFRSLRCDWMNGLLTTDELRTRLLWSTYVSLMADATPKFRKELQARLTALDEDENA